MRNKRELIGRLRSIHNGLFFLPLLTGMVIFRLYPLIRVLITSLKENYVYLTGKYSGFGFANYLKVLEDEFFLQALSNSFFFAAAACTLITLISILTAWCLYRVRPGISAVYRGLIFLPFVTSDIAVGMIWKFMLSDLGVVNHILETVGFFPVGWLTDSSFSMITLILFGVWSRIPMTVLILYCSLLNLDAQHIIAGQTNGAGDGKIFLRIILPQLASSVSMTVVLNSISLWLEVSALFPLFDGAAGPYNNLYLMVYYIYSNMNSGRTFALACAASIMLLIGITCCVLAIRVLLMMKRRKRHDS